jgi:hypothetical protein
VASFIPGNPRADYTSAQETLRAVLHSVIKVRLASFLLTKSCLLTLHPSCPLLTALPQNQSLVQRLEVIPEQNLLLLSFAAVNFSEILSFISIRNEGLTFEILLSI